MSTIDRKRLGDLIFFIAEIWCKSNSQIFGRSQMMYDTTLFDSQNEETAFEPFFKDGRAWFNGSFTTNCGNDWFVGALSIPKWLYDNYLSKRYSFIASSQIQLELEQIVKD